MGNRARGANWAYWRALEGTHDKSGYVNLGEGAGSALPDPVAERHVLVRAQQDHALLLVQGPEDEHLGRERPDPPRREVDHGDNQAPLELVTGVIGDLRRRALLADLRPEVDRQLPGWLPSLGEALDGRYPADADVDGLEVVEVDLVSGCHNDARGYLATRAGNRFVTTAIPQRGGNTTWKRLRSRRPVA